jgi:hypothetical protein
MTPWVLALGCASEPVVLDDSFDGIRPAVGLFPVKPLGDVTLTGTSTDPVVDMDGDGYLPPEDCDDRNRWVYPGAPDAWYDGVDSNCAGDDDFDQDLDGFGTDVGDCDDEDAQVSPGALPTCGDGDDHDCDGVPDCDRQGAFAFMDADVVLLGTVSFASGAALDGGDFNGDGAADLSLDTLADGSHHHVLFGPLAPGTYPLGPEVDLIRWGIASFGTRPWDMDGDGLSDLFYPDVPGLLVYQDRLELWSGPFEGLIEPGHHVWTWNQDGSSAIGDYGQGDFDVDGNQDLLIFHEPSTPFEPNDGTRELWLIPGPLTGERWEHEGADVRVTVTRPNTSRARASWSTHTRLHRGRRG